MGEEKEVAWPERSGLVRPVLCVSCSAREKQVLFLSPPFQSWAPWLAVTPFSCFRASPTLASVIVHYGLGMLVGVPRICRREKARIMFNLVSEFREHDGRSDFFFFF